MKPFFSFIILMANITLIACFAPLKASDHLINEDDMSSLSTLSVSSGKNLDSEEEDLEPAFLPTDLPVYLWPEELILSLLNSMPFPTLITAMQTCKKWKRISYVIFPKLHNDYILYDEQGKRKFISKGPFNQVQDLFFKGFYLINDLRFCDLFPRLYNLVYADPAWHLVFWHFAISEPLLFNHPAIPYYRTAYNWFIHGKILFLFDPLDDSQCLRNALLTLRNFINNAPHIRSKNLDLLEIFTLSSVEADRQMLRIACNERIQASKGVNPHPLEKWLAQVEIQWQIMDSFRAYVQSQLQEAAVATARVTQAQPE